MNLLVGFMN